VNTINLEPKEDVSDLSLSVTSVIKERTIFDNVMEATARTLMMVRNVSVNYRYGDALALQGYTPGSGFLGQNNSAPGYDFTFGFFKADDFLEKSNNNGWLTTSSTFVTPVIRTRTQDFQIRSLVEPISGFKIDLNASWMKNNTNEIYYMFAGKETFEGSYSKTHIAIKTAFKKPKIDSPVFSEFLDNRQEIVARLSSENSIPPDKRFNENSADIMVPAFYAAYSGIDVKKVDMDILPGILTILPNWKVTYDGLSRLDFIKRYFKSFVLNHAYRCTYNINSFSSISNWEWLTGDYGYIPETNSVSSQYYIESVNINEAFYPLIGAEASLKNSLMLKAEYRRSRDAQLDIPGNQVVESYSNEYVFGAGYRIDDFGMIIRLNDNKQKKVKNDLNLRVDVSYKTTDAFIRKIEENFSQLSSGMNSFIIKFSADYVFSESLNIRLYYDRTATTPKVSQGYPTTNTNFGIGFRFLLVR
jgi:cell surface protein SprA